MKKLKKIEMNYLIKLINNIISSLFFSFLHDLRIYLGGECNFRFGMDVVGEESNVRGFNFLVSSSFSQIEHWVMNALFPGISPYGSVTYGLGNVLLNDGSLEILLEDGFVVIKEVNSNVRTLVIDISSGRVMDLLNTSYNGAFCYSNQQTDWACDFGYALLNNTNIFETLVNYFNNVNNTFYYLQDIINGAFESIDDYLDSSNNLILGIVGGFIITAGISLLLISNPVGWVILGSIALVSLGGLLTYYADDLNRGWTAERMSNFIFDISLSLIPGIGFEGRVGKIVLVKEVNRYITKNSMDDLGKIIISYAIEYGFSNVKYIKYGKLESIMHTVIGNTNIEIGKYLFGISIGNVIDIVLDYYYNKENSWIYSTIGDII